MANVEKKYPPMIEALLGNYATNKKTADDKWPQVMPGQKLWPEDVAESNYYTGLAGEALDALRKKCQELKIDFTEVEAEATARAEQLKAAAGRSGG